MKHTLYGVSVGPGDPELMTLKAVRVIEKCRVIAVPCTINDNSLALAIAEKNCRFKDKKILRLNFPMVREKNILEHNYNNIALEICRELEFNDVALLTIGDLSIYSTCSYISDKISRKGYNVELCAGVTSFCASACSAEISLAEKDRPFIVIPYNCENIAELLMLDGKKAVMKCRGHGAELFELLEKLHLIGVTSAVENCGMPTEKIYYGKDIIHANSYFTVYLVGDQVERSICF